MGPRDTASVFLSFPRGTQGGACRQDRVTALDTEVPSVTETRGREEAGTWVQSREGVLKMLFC